MNSTITRVRRMPAIKRVNLNPVINKEDVFAEIKKAELKRVKTIEESPFKNYGSTIFSEINHQEKLLNSTSNGSVAVLNKVSENVEMQDMIDLYYEEKNSCSEIIDRNKECSA